MKKINFSSLKRGAVIMGFLALMPAANAQYFEVNLYGGVIAGFRKTGQFQGLYELVVNLGSVTNFLACSPGETIPISDFSPSQLTDAFPDGYANLQWSVFTAFQGSLKPWSTPFGAFPPSTLWYTFPDTNTTSQTVPPERFGESDQESGRERMLGVGPGAYTIGSVDLIVTNADNNTLLVREPVAYSDEILTAFIGDETDPTFGDFGGGAFPFSVENTTPGAFTSPTRSDFYQSAPVGNTDPITGLTSGAAYFVGYFLLNPDGTMTFTRASTNSVAPAPPPVTLSIGRSSGTSTISFLSSNSVTYTLYFTNAAGLTTPVTNWPSLSGTITGDGTTQAFQDSTTDAVRFYQVLEN